MKFSKADNERILNKLKELKEVFQFGEKIVPMIQSLTSFMEEIIPLLNNVNTSIAESNEKMPIAKTQIENVTSATELATTEILDQIDAAGQTLEEISDYCGTMDENQNKRQEKLDRLKEILKENKEAGKLLDEIEKLTDNKSTTENITSRVNVLNDTNFQMTMSLQVQDITSQQLAAVNHLINNVQGKLETLIDDIDNSKISDQIRDLRVVKPQEEEPVEKVTFDAKATYAKDDRQKKADEVIDDHKERASQDEIDKLFGGG